MREITEYELNKVGAGEKRDLAHRVSFGSVYPVEARNSLHTRNSRRALESGTGSGGTITKSCSVQTCSSGLLNVHWLWLYMQPSHRYIWPCLLT